MREFSEKQTSYHEQVAKRFRLVPNFFVSTPEAPEIIERLWVLPRPPTSTIRSPHSSKNGFLSFSRVSVRSVTALCATPDFLSAMGTQRATQRVTRKPLSR